MNATSDDPNVRVFTDGPLGHLVLANAKTLNALTLDAIVSLSQGLAQHEADPHIKAIVISSASDRAFCAGGQMKSLRDSAINKHYDDIETFFEHEYALNQAIAGCTKPYIALIDGIAMGGGLGISVHGQFRIVTERAVLAMPETRIGFFPDVGASYFLPSLAHRAGYWLGLTSISINADEAVCTGLATHRVRREKLPTLLSLLHASLKEVAPDDYTTACTEIERVLQPISKGPRNESVPGTLSKRALWFADNDLQRIRQRLQEAIVEYRNSDAAVHDDAQQLLTLLDAGSPYSVEITLDLFARTDGLSLADCLELEKQLASQACRHPDFIEGIRSVLVDKDRNPQWQRSPA
jgi:enoyl-CoA hydratase